MVELFTTLFPKLDKAIQCLIVHDAHEFLGESTTKPGKLTDIQYRTYVHFIERLYKCATRYVANNPDWYLEDVYADVYDALLDTYYKKLHEISIEDTIHLYRTNKLDRDSAINWLLTEQVSSYDAVNTIDSI